MTIDITLSKEEIKKKLDLKDGKDAPQLDEILNNIPKPKDGYTPLKNIDYFDGKDGSPDEPKQIRDKLETLEDEDRLDITAIKGIEERIKKIPETTSRPIFGPGKTRVIPLDLSASLNGVTKTFFVGTHFGIIGVWGSSSPFPFRPTVDYTEVGRDIVFSADIDATVSLAAGQTLMLQYLK